MRGKTKNIAILGAASLALFIAGPALAADAPVITKAPMKAVTPPPPVFELAYGASISTDYNFRGVSQSNRDWSFGGYLEARINNPAGQFYLGVAGWRIEWPGPAAPFGFTDPSAEVDFIGGWRKTWDKFGVDIGLIYYYYPGEAFNGFTNDSDFWEVYWKGTYAVNDMLSCRRERFLFARRPELQRVVRKSGWRFCNVNKGAWALRLADRRIHVLSEGRLESGRLGRARALVAEG